MRGICETQIKLDKKATPTQKQPLPTYLGSHPFSHHLSHLSQSAKDQPLPLQTSTPYQKQAISIHPDILHTLVPHGVVTCVLK